MCVQLSIEIVISVPSPPSPFADNRRNTPTKTLSMAVNAEDVHRWMETELRLKKGSSAYQAEKEERAVSMRADDIERIKDIFGLFDSDRRGFVRSVNLPLLLKALGCDDETCQSASSRVTAQTITLDDLEPIALNALEVGRDGHSEASAKKAFLRFLGLATGSADAAGKSYNDEDGAADDRVSYAAGLTMEGLLKAFAQCGARATEDEVKEILAFADLDGDGIIGEEDWIRVMNFVENTQ